MLDKLFAYFVEKRNAKFDKQKINIVKCKIPVISVGNLSVGGTGKTPFVIHICKELLARGKKPAVIGRGYKRKSKGLTIVSNGEKILTSAAEAGDEMLLIAQKLKIPVIAHSKKYIAALEAEKMFDIDYIVIDDGFQHRFLHRNCDIVLIDKNTLEKPFLLPKGRLRESFSALKRADIIYLTKGAKREALEKVLPQNIKPNLKIFESTFVQAEPYNLYNINTKLNNTKIIAVAGIAKPNSFFEMLKNHNYQITKAIAFSDHHNYKIKDIKNIINNAKQKKITDIAITEKDAVKFSEFKELFIRNNIEIYVFPIKVSEAINP